MNEDSKLKEDLESILDGKLSEFTDFYMNSQIMQQCEEIYNIFVKKEVSSDVVELTFDFNNSKPDDSNNNYMERYFG